MPLNKPCPSRLSGLRDLRDGLNKTLEIDTGLVYRNLAGKLLGYMSSAIDL